MDYTLLVGHSHEGRKIAIAADRIIGFLEKGYDRTEIITTNGNFLIREPIDVVIENWRKVV